MYPAGEFPAMGYYWHLNFSSCAITLGALYFRGVTHYLPSFKVWRCINGNLTFFFFFFSCIHLFSIADTTSDSLHHVFKPRCCLSKVFFCRISHKSWKDGVLINCFGSVLLAGALITQLMLGRRDMQTYIKSHAQTHHPFMLQHTLIKYCSGISNLPWGNHSLQQLYKDPQRRGW